MTTVAETKDNKSNGSPSTMIRMYNVRQYYKILQKVGRGTYGTVYKAKGLKDGRYYAIKKLQNNDTKLQQQGFPITALRGTIVIVAEITLLKQIDHPNIIKLKEIIVSRPNKRNLFRGSTFLVFEYMDHDFAGLFKMKIKYTLPEIKCIVKQLLEGVAYLHKNKILHRDIKSANILLNDEGDVKLADFGLGRKFRFENLFTYKVVTLWYRAPQLLLGLKTYSDKIDVWSLGCVVAEFFTGEVLFRKQTEYSQMERIYQIVGDFQSNDIVITQQSSKIYHNWQDFRPRKPCKKELSNYLKRLCPNISQVSIDFIERMLHLDPNRRMSCQEALRHPFFSQKPVSCAKSQIQKMDYQCHEMFKDRSIRIERAPKREHQYQEKFTKEKDIRGYRYEREGRKLQPREYQREKRDREDWKYHRELKQDLQPKKKDIRYKQERSYYYQSRKKQKHYSSGPSSDEDNSNSYTSSSPSSHYSSSEKSPRSRSRHAENPRKPERMTRSPRKNRQFAPRYEREEARRYQRRQQPRYEKSQRRVKDDRYRPSPLDDKRYPPQDRKKFEGSAGRDYREERIRKDDRRYDVRDERREDYQRKEERQPEKREEKREEMHSQSRADRKEQKRVQVREYRERRDSKQRMYQKYERTYEPKDRKHYEQRDNKQIHSRAEREQKYSRPDKSEKYSRDERQKYTKPDERYIKPERQQRYSRAEQKYSRPEQRYSKPDNKYSKPEQRYSRHDKDKYLDQKHPEYTRRDDPVSRRDEPAGRGDKFVFVRQRPGYRKKDHGDSSSSDGSDHLKKDKNYSKQSKPYHYERNQRKHYYKKQHQGNNDHRNH